MCICACGRVCICVCVCSVWGCIPYICVHGKAGGQRLTYLTILSIPYHLRECLSLNVSPVIGQWPLALLYCPFPGVIETLNGFCGFKLRFLSFTDWAIPLPIKLIKKISKIHTHTQSCKSQRDWEKALLTNHNSQLSHAATGLCQGHSEELKNDSLEP